MVTDGSDNSNLDGPPPAAEDVATPGEAGARRGAKWMDGFAKWRDGFVATLTIPMLISVAFTYLSFMGGINFLIDNLSHFRVQYLVFQAIYLVLATTTRRWIVIAICLAGAGCNVSEIAPFYLTKPGVADANLPRLSVLQLNVYAPSTKHQAVTDLITQLKPDIVCLDEVTFEWDKAMTEKLAPAGYTHKIARPRQDTFGIAIYSRLPLIEPQIIESKDNNNQTNHFPVPAIFTKVDCGGEAVSIIAAHPLTPMSEEYFALRNEEFAAINAARDTTVRDPFLLVGDLNCTPWSYYFHKLTLRSKVKNTALGFGLQPTWPTYLLGFRLPIDHVLASDQFIATSYQVLPNLGSDHYPVYVQLALKPRETGTTPKARQPYRK